MKKERPMELFVSILAMLFLALVNGFGKGLTGDGEWSWFTLLGWALQGFSFITGLFIAAWYWKLKK